MNWSKKKLEAHSSWIKELAENFERIRSTFQNSFH